MKFPEAYRWTDIHIKNLRSKEGDPCGIFRIPGSDAHGSSLLVMATDGTIGPDPHLPEAGDMDTGWEHVSVSIPSPRSRIATPSWQEMSFVKELFWEDDQCVVQFHVPVAEHVDNFEALHLWRWTGGEFPRPPKEFV